jgi:hypothetical protein
MKRSIVQEAFMVLGVDGEGCGHVSVVIAADTEQAKKLFARRHPEHTPISFPSLDDLRKSVRCMQQALDGLPLDVPDVDVIDEALPETDDAEDDPLDEVAGEHAIPCPQEILRGIDRIRETIFQCGLDDPFDAQDGDATAQDIKNAAFTASAYQPVPERPGRFEWQDVVLAWTQHVGYDVVVSREMAAHEIHNMVVECRAALLLEVLK